MHELNITFWANFGEFPACRGRGGIEGEKRRPRIVGKWREWKRRRRRRRRRRRPHVAPAEEWRGEGGVGEQQHQRVDGGDEDEDEGGGH